MSIQKAQLFLNKVQEDIHFRKKVICANSEHDLSTILRQYNINFSSTEIENAFNMLHVSCQTEDDAEKLKHAYLYYQLLVSSFTN
jgi:predicted ribosomally synthesized peptide with nif11-like leader